MITIRNFKFILIRTWIVFFVISLFPPAWPIHMDLWTGCEHDKQALSHWQGQSANHRDSFHVQHSLESLRTQWAPGKQKRHCLMLKPHPLVDLRKMSILRTVWAFISHYLFCYFFSVICIFFSCILGQRNRNGEIEML